MRKIFSFLTAILFAGSMMATNYELVTSASQLQAGAKYVIGTATGKFIATTSNSNNRKITDGTITENVVEGTNDMMVFTLGGEADAWTFATDNYLGTAGYLNATSTTGSNYLKVVADLDDYAYFTIAIADGVTTVTCNGKASRNILYLNGTTCFACYNSQTQAQYIKPNLYKEVSVAPLTTVKTVYCKCEQSWWTKDNAAVGIYAFADGDVKNANWPGVRMDAVKGVDGVWKADIDTAKYAKIIFTRMNPSDEGNQDWGAKTADLVVPADKDLYTITSTSAVWGDPGVTGEWSVYGDTPTPPTPPTPVDSMTVYLVNTLDWANVNAFVWPAEGNAYKEWPGEAMTPVNTQINGKDVYAYTFPASFVNIIFNNGTDQTVDLTWAEATPYFVPGEKNAQNKYEGAWYAKENIPAPVDPAEGGTVIFEWTKGAGAKIETDNTDLSANDMGAMTVGTSVVARLLGTNAVDNNAKGYKLGNNDVCVEIQGTQAFAVGDTVVITGVCGGSGARAFAIAPATTINAVTDTALTSTQENTSDILEYKVVVKEAQAGDKMRIFRMAGKTMYLYSIKVVHPADATPEPPVAAKFYVTGDSALVTDAGFAGKAWNPDAIKAEADTLVLNLKAEQVYKLKVTTDGTWNTAKGFNNLSEKPEGLTMDNDENIIFSLAEAGAVKVIYIAGETPIFKIVGNFYVAPVPVPAKYYLTGDSALVVDAGLAAEKAWDPMAIKSETDTFALSLKANQEYKLKLIEDGDWNGGKVYGYDALTVKADGLSADADGNIVFKLNTASAVQVVYFWEEVATDDWKMTFKLLGDFYVAPEPPVVEHTYTVAGGSDVLFGTTWAPANTDNDMVKQEDGTYKWEKTGLTLPAGAIEFKVCEDHAWTTCWPAQNYSLAIAEAGIYTITITFNPAAEENKVAAVATKTGSAVVDPTVSVKGSWDGWANELKFTLADNKETATLTVENIKAGTYEFKVILNGSDWRSNGYEYHREFTGAEGITGNDPNNMKIVADVDGTYSFTWTFATNALNITFPKTGTGVDNTADGIKAVKVIRDGQLLIIKGEKTFNTQGQLVK